MKQSKTTLKELTAAYRAVLRHGILCNAIALGLIAAVPARAETITERQVVENGVVLDLSDIGASNIDSAGLYGGVYFIDNGNVTINGGNFDGNSAATSGAIESRRGTLTINNSTFSGNHATTSSGAIETWTDSSGPSNKLIINNSEFVDNYAPTFGTLSVFGMAGINEINNSHFITNHANSTLEGSDGDHDHGDGGAVFLGSKARLKITGTEFIGNTATSEGGALSTRSELQDNSASGLEIESSTFTANTAAKNGGALYLNIAHNTTLSGEASIKDSTFTMNTSTNGGAIYNDAEDGAGNMARVSIADTNFVGNVALGKGGAIYNKGEMFIEALHSDVEFYDNMAGGAANDIYNENLLWLTANTGQTISFAGGIDGHNGTIIMLGGGLIDVSNTLDNQTVTVSNGTLLHLSDPMTLNNSTIDVVDSAMLNTLDNTINADYNSHITLGNGTFVMFDADATGIDTFNIASGDQVTVGSFNMLSDIDSASVVRNLATAGNISVAPNMNAYTTASQYTLTGNSANSGQVTITKSGVGGLNAVAGNTTAGNHEVVNYAVTANDASVSSADVTIQNAEVMLVGAGTDSGAVGVTLGKKINVDGDSSLEILNAKFNGDGSIETTGGDLSIHASSMDVDITNGTDGVAVIIGSELAAGNTLENNGAMYVMDSRIASNVNNFFEYHSDPTYYEAQFVNEGHAWFDGDIFESTASLINNGMVDLNSVEFRQGSTINGTGTLYIGGTTIFDGVVSNNSLEIGSGTNLVIGEHGSINGADNVTLTAFGGNLNLNNGKIDTLGDVVANADLGLSVDANLSGGGAIDSVAALTGTGKLIVNSINLTSSSYADSGESVTLTLANTGNIELGENLTVTGGMNYYTDVHTDGEGNIVFSDKLMNTSGLYAQLGSWNGTIIGTSSAYDAETNSYTSTGTTVGAALMALETAVNGKQNTIVNSATIATNGTGGLDVVAGSIGATQLANNAVASANIIDGTIVNADIAAGTITTDRLANQAVSQFTNDAGYQNATQVGNAISAALANGDNAYQTASDVAGTLESYSTTTQMNSAISNALANSGNAYQTASDVNGAIADALANNGDAYQTESQVNTTVNNAISSALGTNGAVGGAITTATTMADDGNANTTLYSNFSEGASVTSAVASLDSAIGTTAAGTHVAATNSVGQNINALDSAIGSTNTGNHVTSTNSVGQNLNSLDTALASAESDIDTLNDQMEVINGDENTTGSMRNIAKSYFDLVTAQDNALTLSQANAYTDERIEKLDKDLSAGIASAVALSSVAVSDVRRGELSVGAGYGYFNGQSAGAFGAAMGISNRWSVNAGAGVSGYDVSFRAGTNYKFRVF